LRERLGIALPIAAVARQTPRAVATRRHLGTGDAAEEAGAGAGLEVKVYIRDRVEHLIVSLFCQRVIRALFRYVENGEIESPLKDALSALQNVHNGEIPRNIFNTYKQIRVLEDAWSPEERDMVAQAIMRLLSGAAYEQDVRLLVDKFNILGNRARGCFELGVG